MHDPVERSVSFPALEERILEWWRATGIPGQALRHREGATEWVFYEGPPYANNPPGIHHVLARAYKDVYCRYQTARGRFVPRKAGWDCHGLPVEVEVEKQLGFKHKKDILDYGIDRFNAACRNSVRTYVADWERLTERMAYWLDLSDAYLTMSDEYIESVWWSLAELHRRGLLYEGEKVTPYCPRCETPLSDHELGMPDAYREVADPGVTVAFPIPEGPLAGAALAIWTTTPWTLVSNLAVAVHPSVTYAVVRQGGRRLVVAEELVEAALGPGWVVERTLLGSELAGTRYEPPYDFARAAGLDLSRAWQVLTASFVVTSEGTGLVHLAPAFGADDLEACRAAGIPTFNPVDGSGRFDHRAPPFAGRFVKDADADIVADLARRGLLVREETYVHPYPHCWRCQSPLLYYALTSWYVRTTAVRDRMLELNAGVRWVPAHIRDGRFGNWLAGNVDWSLSRFRFWGTPLPIWRCASGHDTAVESRADLERRAGRDLSGLDLHRPWVDEVTFPCPSCGAEARRIPDLIDVWYDSGAMPFAQYGYPHRNAELFRRRYPADFISEAIDQTRGWFYSLMAEGTLLFDQAPYRNVVCLELIVDEAGRKMSKSLGNVVDPWEVFGRYGADAVRFFLLCSSPPAAAKRVSPKAISDVVRGFMLTLWNVYRLYVLYANVDGFDPNTWSFVDPSLRPATDRWILSELHQTIAEATAAMDAYDCTRAGRRIAAFVDDLSNWYVRRSRRRFWRQARTDEERTDKAAAYWTLWTCLADTARLLAPFMPFLSEELYRNLVAKPNPAAPPSVHLADWPSADHRLIDPALSEGMAAARTLVSLGRKARAEAGVKVRQPLRRASVLVPPGLQGAVEGLLGLVAEELNVKEVALASERDALVTVSLRPNYPVAGPALGPRVRAVAEALAAAGPAAAAAAAQRLEQGLDVEIAVDGETLRLSPEMVEIRREPAAGTAFAYEAPFGISLDLELTPDLRREGVARELVHQLQNLRKQADLEVTDRVRVTLAAPPEVLEALEAHAPYVREEVLAVELAVAEALPDGAPTVAVDGHRVTVSLERA